MFNFLWVLPIVMKAYISFPTLTEHERNTRSWVIVHFNPLHPSPSLYLSGLLLLLYVIILQSKPFVVFFNLEVVTHGLKNYFCQQLLLWCSLCKTNHTQTDTNLHSSCSVESAVYIGQRHHASFVLQ